MINNSIWFSTGFEHILDWQGYDHMLFMALLALSYPPAEWKKMLGLITAFTLGHSLTLALSVSNIIHLNQSLIEFLIVLTIAITALFVLLKNKNTPNRGTVIYLIICCFSLVHGMGFSFLLKSMLGHEQSIVMPLLMFNLGLEAGQVIFVTALFGLLFLVNKKLNSVEMHLKTGLTSLIFVVALILCYSRLLNILQE